MATVFWDHEGVPSTKYLRAEWKKGRIVTKEMYVESLYNLQKAIKAKCPGLLTEGVIILHDNVQACIAGITVAFLTDFGWITFQHPPYSQVSHSLITTSSFGSKCGCELQLLSTMKICKLDWMHGLKTWTKVSMFVVVNCLNIGTIKALGMTTIYIVFDISIYRCKIYRCIPIYFSIYVAFHG